MNLGHVEVGSSGRYVLDVELGSGGFGTTYRARRESDDAIVVIKYVRIDRVQDWKAVADDSASAAPRPRGRRARIPGYIDHGNPDADGDVGAPDGGAPFFIVQEYIDGRRLDEVMQARNSTVRG